MTVDLRTTDLGLDLSKADLVLSSLADRTLGEVLDHLG